MKIIRITRKNRMIIMRIIKNRRKLMEIILKLNENNKDNKK